MYGIFADTYSKLYPGSVTKRLPLCSKILTYLGRIQGIKDDTAIGVQISLKSFIPLKQNTIYPMADRIPGTNIRGNLHANSD